MKSVKGVCFVSGITFKVNDDLGPKTIQTGSYEIRVTDVTRGLPPRMLMRNTKILLKLVDLDAEAAAAAAAAAAANAAKTAGKKK